MWPISALIKNIPALFDWFTAVKMEKVKVSCLELTNVETLWISGEELDMFWTNLQALNSFSIDFLLSSNLVHCQKFSLFFLPDAVDFVRSLDVSTLRGRGRVCCIKS